MSENQPNSVPEEMPKDPFIEDPLHRLEMEQMEEIARTERQAAEETASKSSARTALEDLGGYEHAKNVVGVEMADKLDRQTLPSSHEDNLQVADANEQEDRGQVERALADGESYSQILQRYGGIEGAERLFGTEFAKELKGHADRETELGIIHVQNEAMSDTPTNDTKGEQ